MRRERARRRRRLPGDVPSGLIVDLADGAPDRAARQAPASANLAARPPRQDRDASCSGAATRRRPAQRFTTPDAPIAYDLDAAGKPRAEHARSASTGVHWDEVPSLYGAGKRRGLRGPARARRRRDRRLRRRRAGRAADDRPRQRDGDLPRRRRHGGRGRARARSTTPARQRPRREEGRGRRADRGRRRPGRRAAICAGSRRRAPVPSAAPSRSRTSSTSRSAYPGVTHAAAWNGQRARRAAPAAAAACISRSSAAARPARGRRSGRDRPLSGYLDARRDATVPLCVCAGVVTRHPSADGRPRRRPAARARRRRRRGRRRARSTPTAPLGPGQPRPRPAARSLRRLRRDPRGRRRRRRARASTLPGADGELGRRAAERYELLVPRSPAADHRRHSGVTRDAPVADWLPRALRDAPGTSTASRACSTCCSTASTQQRRAARSGHRPASGTTSSSRAAPTGRCRTSARSSASRRTPSRLEVAYAIALRRRKGTPAALEDFAEVAHRLHGARARGLAGHRLGAAPRPPAAAAGRVDVDLRRRQPLPDRHAVRPRAPQRHAVRAVRPARGDGRRLAVAGRHLPRGRGGAALPSRARFALHPLGAEAPLYLNPRPGAAAERRRRVGRPRAPATSSTRRSARPTASSRRSPAPARSPTGSNWTGRRRPPARGRHRAAAPMLLDADARRRARPVDEPALRLPAARRAGARAAGGRRGGRRPRARPRSSSARA